MYRLTIAYNGILSFALIGSFLIAVLLGSLHIPLPTQMVTYAISLGLIMLLKIKTNKYKLISLTTLPIVFFYIFSILFIFYTYTSISVFASAEKLTLLFYLVLVPILILSLIDYDWVFKNYYLFLKSLRNFSMAILLIYFILFNLGFYEAFVESNRLYLLGTGNPIWYSRNIMFMVFAILFADKILHSFSIWSFIVVLMAMYLLFISGSRTPIVALVFTYMVFYLKGYSYKQYFLFFSIFTFLILISLFVFSDNRMFSTDFYSMLERFALYEEAYALIQSNIFGYGIGSFGLLSWHEDVRFYPHNIFIEVFLEMGIVGFIIFCIMIFYAFKSYSKNNLFFYLFLLAFIGAQSSGDMVGNKYVFIMLYMSIIFKRNSRRYGL